MNIRSRTKNMVIIGVLTALLIIMSVTPLGYLKIGVIEITFNMIPVAIGAILLGPTGGAILGGIFGLTSLGQAMGVLGSSPFGAMLLAINPLFTVILCIVPRTLDGFLVGVISRWLNKISKFKLINFGIAGFLSAALNTVFFMCVLKLLFSNKIFLSVLAFVLGSGPFEALVASILTAFIVMGLYKAKLTNTIS